MRYQLVMDGNLDGEILGVLWYEGPHTPALVQSDLLEEDINIEDEQMHLASSDEDDDWLIQSHDYPGKWCINILNV